MTIVTVAGYIVMYAKQVAMNTNAENAFSTTMGNSMINSWIAHVLMFQSYVRVASHHAIQMENVSVFGSVGSPTRNISYGVSV